MNIIPFASVILFFLVSHKRSVQPGPIQRNLQYFVSSADSTLIIIFYNNFSFHLPNSIYERVESANLDLYRPRPMKFIKTNIPLTKQYPIQ